MATTIYTIMKADLVLVVVAYTSEERLNVKMN